VKILPLVLAVGADGFNNWQDAGLNKKKQDKNGKTIFD